jgi:hypothetical protein
MKFSIFKTLVRNLGRNKLLSFLNVVGLTTGLAVAILIFNYSWQEFQADNQQDKEGNVYAFVIATPVAYYLMNQWLRNFAYKTVLSWWIFAVAGFLVLSIGLLTVSWQTLKVASRNPVRAIRYE